MKDEHQITIRDDQRQMLLLALAILLNKRPGWILPTTEIALLMDNKLPDGRPQMMSDFQKYNSVGPITLEWEWIPENLEFLAKVPATNYGGTGYFEIHAIKRPDYCDRGKYHVIVEPNGIAGLDCQEGFPRYYFQLDNLKEEMTYWVNNRDACRRAVSQPG